MTIDDLNELYFITPIDSVPSILQHGILSHNQAEQILHRDISMPEIQVRRRGKRVLGGRPLHDYANLYFDAHNPMLSKRRDQNDSICVLGISIGIMNLPGVIITDMNAASDYAKFYSSPEGLEKLDYDKIFSRFWLHPDPFEERAHKLVKCSEVLIPDIISPKYIERAYVYNDAGKERLQNLGFILPILINAALFF